LVPVHPEIDPLKLECCAKGGRIAQCVAYALPRVSFFASFSDCGKRRVSKDTKQNNEAQQAVVNRRQLRPSFIFSCFLFGNFWVK